MDTVARRLAQHSRLLRWLADDTVAASLAAANVKLRPLTQVASGSATAVAADARSDNIKRESGTALRFYKRVGVWQDEGGGGFGVQLDGRRVRTPARQMLLVPSLPLALAIAGEWEYQEQRSVRPFTMPLMGLAATALDQPRPREEVITTLLHYLDHDAMCCRHEPGALADRQKVYCDPVVSWASQRFGTQFDVSDDLFGGRQPVEAKLAFERYLEGLDKWTLTACDALASALKSVLAGCAVAEGGIGPAEAILAVRVEEDMQIEEWGLVEGGHDIDKADVRVRVYSPPLFLRLLRAAE